MNVSQIYGSMSRVLIYWLAGRLPASKATLVADVLVVQSVLEVVQRRLRSLADEGDEE